MKSSKLVSVAMKHKVARLKKKFGNLDTRFWSEDKGKYYTGVDLSCSILGQVASVLRNGTVEMR